MIQKGLIDLEIDFALKAAMLEPTDIDNALFKYTSLYGMLFIPSPIRDPSHPEWQKYLKFIKRKNIKDATFDYYCLSLKKRGVDPKYPYSDKPCFFCSTDGDKAYLHFNNYEGAEPGPLSKERILNRKKELIDSITKLKKDHPEVKTVNGYSWLYNLPSYCRLFPKEFIESADPVYDDFSKLNIWGQFLDSAYNLKDDLVEEFIVKLNSAKDFTTLKRAFRYYQIKVCAPVKVFYDYYIKPS